MSTAEDREAFVEPFKLKGSPALKLFERGDLASARDYDGWVVHRRRDGRRLDLSIVDRQARVCVRRYGGVHTASPNVSGDRRWKRHLERATGVRRRSPRHRTELNKCRRHNPNNAASSRPRDAAGIAAYIVALAAGDDATVAQLDAAERAEQKEKKERSEKPKERKTLGTVMSVSCDVIACHFIK